MAVLLPILGTSWVFGVLAVNSQALAFQYIFAILNSLQVSALGLPGRLSAYERVCGAGCHPGRTETPSLFLPHGHAQGPKTGADGARTSVCAHGACRATPVCSGAASSRRPVPAGGSLGPEREDSLMCAALEREPGAEGC